MLLEEANEKRVIEIGYELALALDYLHNDLNISHGDLKLSNVLMKKSSIVKFKFICRNCAISASPKNSTDNSTLHPLAPSPTCPLKS